MLDYSLPYFRWRLKCSIEFISLHDINLWVVFCANKGALIGAHRNSIIFTMYLTSTQKCNFYFAYFLRWFLNLTSFQFLLFDFIELRSLAVLIRYCSCARSIEISTWQLLVTCIALFRLTRILNYNFADLKSTTVNDEDFITFFTLLCYNLTTIANFFHHTEMKWFKRSFR